MNTEDKILELLKEIKGLLNQLIVRGVPPTITVSTDVEIPNPERCTCYDYLAEHYLNSGEGFPCPVHKGCEIINSDFSGNVWP